MASFKIVLRKDKAKPDGTCPLFLRIIEKRKARFVSLGMFVKPADWNERTGRVRRSHFRHKAMNDYLDGLTADMQVKASELKRKRPVSADMLQSVARGKSPEDLFNFTESHVLGQYQSKGQFREVEKYRSLLNKIEKHTGKRSLLFAELDHDWLLKFEAWMRDERRNKTNTRAKWHHQLKRVIKMAIREGITDPADNPYLHFKIKRETTTRDKLSYEEIQAMAAVCLPPGSFEYHARNSFLFSFYCAGIRFGDICRMSKDRHVRNGRLVYQMSKTRQNPSIKLLPPALEILEEYPDTGRIFPLISESYPGNETEAKAIQEANRQVNAALNEIARRAGINRRISFHMSRHSFADYARKSGMSLYAISKALAHHSLSMTEGYLKSFDQDSIDDEMSELFGQ